MWLDEISSWGEGGGPQGDTNGSAAAAPAWWKQSASHDAKLLSRNWTEIGVGRAYIGHNAERQYWTIDFGRTPTRG